MTRQETDAPIALTPDMLRVAYANGYFPMAMSAEEPELYWFSPEERGVLPLATFNIPRGMKKILAENPFTLTVDTAFEAVIRACGEPTPQRPDTWINEEIVALYAALHHEGDAHSVEVWQEGRLVGGLYGVSLGGAFFGESMFSRVPQASKIALVTLVEILREAEYRLLDTQYVNEHLKQFGVEAVRKRTYLARLAKALSASPNPSTRFSTVSVRRGLASASSVKRN